MGLRWAKWLLLGLLLVALALALSWATSSDPRGNVASFEQEEQNLQLASLNEAVTLAQVTRSGDVVEHRSAHLGDIVIEVSEERPAP